MALPVPPPHIASDRVLQRLTALHPKLIDLSLDRVRTLLAALGDPQTRLAPVIHVAGTNGKGSTVAMMRAVLEAAALRVHVYTSPHLVRFHERIRLAGHLIGEDALVALLEECETANRGAPITFFEITTVAAFLAFARHPADLVLLETGLGGRLDATNLIDRPAATAITAVSLDHQHYLGDTLEAIAGEKAGILKPGVPAVIARQDPAAARVIAAHAAASGAPLLRQGREWAVRRTASGLEYRSAAGRLDLPLPALPGTHQLGNAGVALACLEAAGVPLTAETVAAGLRRTEWPGRLQHLARGPLVEALPPGWDLWLDGGHNPGAGRALASVLASWRRAVPGRPIRLILGMLRTKDATGFLSPLAPHLADLQAVTIPGADAALPAAEAASQAAGAGIAAAPAQDLPAALAALVRADPRPSRVLVCGSLYLAGVVLAEHG